MSGESWCMSCGATVPALTRHSWDDCVRNHEKRIKALEAQLGAATSGVVPVSAADCPGLHTTSGQSITQAGESGSGSAAAPSVSECKQLGITDDDQIDCWVNAVGNHGNLARRVRYEQEVNKKARDLAAAVTRWYERGGRNDSDEADLMDIVGAFCRGEKLPKAKP